MHPARISAHARPHRDPETVAEAYLALLKARGVDWLFANAGTDFAPIIEALVRGAKAGLAMPEPVVVPHENAAVGMAHGYYLLTGRPQAVMVHVNVGMANALMGLLNAARDNVPIFFTSGRTPLTESGRTGSRDVPIHWGQEMYDQGGMLREYVKWDYELRYGEQVEAIVDRALAIAMAEPRGPIYLSLPREALAAPLEGFAFDATPRQVAPAPPAPDVDAIDRAAAILAKAERPLIVTARAGRAPGGAAALARFAERFAMPVVEFWPAQNSLPSTHPMHAGGDVEPWLARGGRRAGARFAGTLDPLAPCAAARLPGDPGRPRSGLQPGCRCAASPRRSRSSRASRRRWTLWARRSLCASRTRRRRSWRDVNG